MRWGNAILLLLLAWTAAWSTAQTAPSPPPAIPPGVISRLSNELAAVEGEESVTQRRRACKHIVRSAESLLEDYPEAPNRFLVMGIVFDVWKTLFSTRQNDEYREALLKTAEQLLEAPDEYAEVRLEAEVLVQQRELAKTHGTPQDRAMAIAALADRYRGTAAEAKSLMMASMIAFDLGNRPLLEAFRKSLSVRFGQDPKVSAFLHERFGANTAVQFRGTFKQAEGRSTCFPLGQVYVMCFWSVATPSLDRKVEEVKALQTRYPGQFDVFSFNLDERSDGGEGLLRSRNLDWRPMLLPGGVDNPIYLSIGGTQLFAAVVVDAYGWARADAVGGRPTALHKRYEAAMESPRHLALLRALCIGDFLIIDPPVLGKGSVLHDAVRDIQACFAVPPRRYRLTPGEALKNYKTAEQLCAAAAAKHPDAPDLWVVHNRRVIALLGMWRLTGDQAYLERAVATAKAALAMDLPRGAATVPRFCLATSELTREDTDPAQALASFTEAAGGRNAPAATYAAALMLAVEAHSLDLYIKYRDILLNDCIEASSAWWVTSFLLDRSCASRLYERALPATREDIRPSYGGDRVFTAAWTTLDGHKTNFADRTDNKIHAVVFMEPTDTLALQKKLMDHLAATTTNRSLRDLDVTGVFLCDDASRASALMARNRWSFTAVCLPETEWHPLVRQTGIFAPDLRPNVYLIRPNGTTLLALSGASPDSENADNLTFRVDAALRDYDLGLADQALEAGDIQQYAARLSTSFPLKARRRARYEPEWLAVSSHRRKLIWAYMQMQDWKRALDAVNINIESQLGKHRPPDAKKATWCRTCYGYLYAMFVRASLLRKMGAEKEADEVFSLTQSLAQATKCPLGLGLEPLLADVETSIANRMARFQHLNDPKVYLAEHDQSMRRGCQDLYGFKLEHDLMMRARIQEKLGNLESAAADRRNAAVRAWPFPVREFDPRLVHEASVRRRELARKHLAAGQWTQVLECVNTNIDIHEAEALRCDSSCRICGDQIQSLQFRAKTLKELGRTEEAEASLAMAEAAKCPTADVSETFNYFPVNRMYGGGSGLQRLHFIDGHMRGEVYANKQDRMYRLEFAADLLMRAQAMDHLGEAAKAARDRQRAAALTFPTNPKLATAGDGMAVRYVDVIESHGANVD